MHVNVQEALIQLDALIEELNLTMEVLGAAREVFAYDQTKQLMLDRDEADLKKMRENAEEIKDTLIKLVQFQSNQN